MKKTAFFMVVLFLLQSVWAYAAQNPEDLQKDVETIEIAFQIGSDILRINGSDTQVETAPYVVGEGVTMVPIRVITEAFGAVVDWNEAEQSITITYSGVVMRLVVGSIEATINGQTLTMLSPPEVYNDRTMVPLRFISENFGADVSYDAATDSVLVVKESFGDAVLDNYNSILKKTDKARVGDSYYCWSMLVPKELRLTERTFDGAATYFTSDDMTIGVEIVPVVDTEGQFSLDKLGIAMKQIASASPNTFIAQNEGTQGGEPYYEVSYKDNSYQYDQRAFYKDKKIYYLWAIRDLTGDASQSAALEETRQSFEIKYAFASDTEDLSNVENGLRPFENKELGIATRIPAEWVMLQNSASNEMQFVLADDSCYGRLYINVFSKPAGETADDWAARDLETLQYIYNSEAADFTGPEPVVIGGVQGAQTKCSVTVGADGGKTHNESVYLTGGNYKYQLTFLYDDATAENSAYFSKAREMIKGFTFTEPDAATLGQLQEPEPPYADDDVVDSVVLNDNKYRLNIPTGWLRTVESGIDSFRDAEGTYAVMVVPISYAPSAYDLRLAWIRELENLYRDNDFHLEDKSPLKLDIKGMEDVQCFFYSNTTTGADPKVSISYVFVIETKNQEYYIVECSSADYFNGQRARDLFTSIVTSFGKNE